MNPTMLQQIQGYMQQSLNDTNTFDAFIDRCKWYYERPAHSLQEIKSKESTKVKGDVFEHFAYIYFAKVKKYDVWFLKDLPKDLRERLGLKKVDLGIDLVAHNKQGGPDGKGRYYAIQVKYRKANKYKSKTILGWKQLSTFYGLVSKTGPDSDGQESTWRKHIVFTNADYIRHVGKKGPKDWSICKGTLRGIKRDKWEAMMGFEGHKLKEGSKKKKLSLEELREARLKALSVGV